MKVFLALALLAVSATALPLNEVDDRVSGENGWFVPQADGSFEWVSTEEFADMEMMEGRLSTNPVNFYLYTKSNPTTKQEITSTAKSIAASNFNAAHPTRFVIHGWTQSESDSMNKEIRDAWLSHGEHNVIVVDWGRARSLEYASSVLAVPTAGEKVGKMINYLHSSHGMSLDTLHVIGHSLGAHVAGHAGKTVGSGKIHTIVGLDTALPLFSYNTPAKRLASTDGYYVESIHTNGGTLGFVSPIGRGAFYPNGGKSQPGCGIDLTGSCAHSRSVTYYVEAVKANTFPSMKCASYEDAVAKNCGSTFSSIRMGSNANAYVVDGEFFVPVNSASPFGMGA